MGEQQCGCVPEGLLSITLICDGGEQCDPGQCTVDIWPRAVLCDGPRSRRHCVMVSIVNMQYHIPLLPCEHRCADKQLSISDLT